MVSHIRGPIPLFRGPAPQRSLASKPAAEDPSHSDSRASPEVSSASSALSSTPAKQSVNGDSDSINTPEVSSGSSSPPPSDTPPRSRQRWYRHRRTRRIGITVVAISIVITAVYITPAQWLGRVLPGYSIVDSDAVAVRPGDVFVTADRVTVEDIEWFEPGGEILFLTVSVDSDVTVLEWMESSLDDTIELRTRESVYGDRSSQQQRQFNAGLMQSAKDISAIVALEYLGVETRHTTGVAFAEVLDDKAASGRLAVGDVIVAIDGEPINTVTALVESMAARSPGSTAVLTVHHHETGESREEEITLGAHPENDGGFIGIGGVHNRVELLPLPFDINIDSGSVGGPSAGLAFTLALLDGLTQGELTGGLSVAVTGSISVDGSVGNVGGARQKAATARSAGADLFIVPNDLIDAAISGAGDMTVVGVGSLTDALEVLGRYGGEVTGLTLSDDLGL